MKKNSVAHPPGLQQVSLALQAVLYVDQAQQIFLGGTTRWQRWREITSDGQKKRQIIKVSLFVEE